ncbi:MAG: bile acid:sodium symporter [Fibrobacterota bacterium]
MMNTLLWLKKNLTIAIPVTMIAGFLFGISADASFLKHFIMPLTFLMVYPMMVNLNIRRLFEGGDIPVQAAAQLLNFTITPFIAWGLGALFFPDNTWLALGLLLTGLLPTSGMTISWTGMARGNMPAAVKMTVFGLLAGSLLTPLYVQQLMGADVAIDMAGIFRQIGLIVVLPLIAGNLTRLLLQKRYGTAKYEKDVKPIFPPLSTIGVVGIVFAAMALKAPAIAANPGMLLTIFLPLTLLYAFNFLISITVAKLFFNRGNGIALLYGTVMRNLSIALAIAMTAFGTDGSEIALVVALGYIIQVQSAAWVVKLTDHIFGPAAEDRAEQIMHRGVFSLHEDQSLEAAIRLLAEEHIHSFAVRDSSNEICGILTQENLIEALADGADRTAPLKNLSLQEPLLADIHMPVSKLLSAMKRSHEYKIIITDASGTPAGVVTASDILTNDSRR